MGKNKKGQPNRGKGKQVGNTDCDSLSRQLRQNGFSVTEMLGDGNCLFRALAHQYEDGNVKNHIDFRMKVVEHIKSNKMLYEPFMEDDVTFDDHVKELAEPGTYGGNDSIVAFSRLYNVTIVIHQFNCPAWVVHSPVQPPKKILNISYHNADHYNSVGKINGTIELTKEENPKSAGDGKEKNNVKKNNNNNSKPSEKSLSEPRMENLKITDDADNETTTAKNNKSDTPKPTPQNKAKLSRRQKLDMKKKDRKAESMQRKRGNSLSESSKSIVSNSLGNTPIVKTLNI